MNKINFGEWEAVVDNNWTMMAIDIYLYRRTPQGKEVLDHTGTIHQIKEGEASTKEIYFARLEEEQVQALADAFSKKGIKTESNYKLEGLLEATKYHLEDMRTIALNVESEQIGGYKVSYKNRKPNKSVGNSDADK